MSSNVRAKCCCPTTTYVQAFKCSNNASQDMWAEVGTPMAGGAVVSPGGVFLSGGDCYYWGAPVATAGGTLINVSALTSYASCALCLAANPPPPAPGCYGAIAGAPACFDPTKINAWMGGQTPSRWTVTTAGITTQCRPIAFFGSDKLDSAPNNTWTVPFTGAQWDIFQAGVNPFGFFLYQPAADCTGARTARLNLQLLVSVGNGGACGTAYSVQLLLGGITVFIGTQCCAAVLPNTIVIANNATFAGGFPTQGGVAVLTPC
jgi:hypothetical protein